METGYELGARFKSFVTCFPANVLDQALTGAGRLFLPNMRPSI